MLIHSSVFRIIPIFVLAGFVSNVVFAEDKIVRTVKAEPKALTGEEIVAKCDNKYPGEDQKSQLSITLTDKSGNERKTIYLRLWKDIKGADNIFDKMTLFTLYPPDAKGAGFMRWAYTANSEKSAEQWIYLPVLRKIRRVSVRDLSDSFLGSDLTYGDISYRNVDADEHRLIKIDKDRGNNEYYLVASVPKEAKPQYSRRMSWYAKTPDMDACVKVRVDYFDNKGSFLKRQLLKWQKVNDAWVWSKVKVTNAQTAHKSFFEVEKVKINTGIKEAWFTERKLQQGIR